MLATKDLYTKACLQSKELHALTNQERTSLQAHLRMMYKEIEQVCNRHNLRMCAGYGTVLGAIRHQGFIPWDDDMDLLMPREDYDKFIQLYADELPKSLKIFAPNSKNGPITRFAKVVDTETRFLAPGEHDDESSGIFIDIFPVENSITSVPIIKIKRIFAMMLMVISSCVHQHTAHEETYRSLMCSTPAGKRTYTLRNCIGWLFGCISFSKWYNYLDKFLQHKDFTGFVSVPSGDGAQWKYFQPYEFSLYFPAQKVPFDDIDIYIPNQAEKHCEIEYGNWRWIPPVESRWQHYIKVLSFKNC